MNTSWLWPHWFRFVQRVADVASAAYLLMLIVMFSLLATTVLLGHVIIASIHHVSVRIYLLAQDWISAKLFMLSKMQCFNAGILKQLKQRISR